MIRIFDLILDFSKETQPIQFFKLSVNFEKQLHSFVYP